MKYAILDKDRIDLFRRTRYRLFKTLLSSACRMDCLYCPLSRYCRFSRSSWGVEELVRVFTRSYRAGRVDGLFLTSTLYGDPDTVVERMIEVIERLRRKGYRGYIHLRLMPGVSKDLLFHAAVLSDRIGLNIEAPRTVFREIAPSKADWLQDIVKRLEWLACLKRRFRRTRQRVGYISRGIDTQFVLGAGDETDLEVLETAWMLLRKGVDRIYISGFKPYRNTPLEDRRPTPRWRALRVMQAIELLRTYGYRLDELKTLVSDNGMLPNKDPKILYAEHNKHLYPVDLNNDPYELIVRVPGIGPRTAAKILELREKGIRVTVDKIVRLVGYKRYLVIRKYVSLEQ